MGFASGSQLDKQEVLEKASFVPRAGRVLLEADRRDLGALRGARRDVWVVVLTEETSGTEVASFLVSDDSGKVGRVEVLPAASGIEYPRLSERKAVKLAAASPEVRDELSDHGPYTTRATYEDGEWTVRFYVDEKGAVGGRPTDDGKEVATVGVDDETWVLNYVYTGDQVGWNMARGVRGAYGKQANYWWVWLPLALAFAAAFWRTDRLLSMRNLDIVALLGFLVSHGFYRQGVVFEAVVLWYPPLVYLFVRTLLMGFGIGERVEKTSNLPMWLLMVLAGLAGGLVLGLNVDSRVIDVGYAGVVGADRILDGTIPYGNMPADVGTGDTYGPLNYLLYVPFVLMFGFSGEWDFLPAAHALTLFSFVAGAMALFITGYRLSGKEGAAALIFAWAAFPYTVYATNNNTNDIIVAAVAAIGLAAAASPDRARGQHRGRVRRQALPHRPRSALDLLRRASNESPIVDFVLGGAGVSLLTFWVVLLDGRPLRGCQALLREDPRLPGRQGQPVDDLHPGSRARVPAKAHDGDRDLPGHTRRLRAAQEDAAPARRPLRGARHRLPAHRQLLVLRLRHLVRAVRVRSLLLATNIRRRWTGIRHQASGISKKKGRKAASTAGACTDRKGAELGPMKDKVLETERMELRRMGWADVDDLMGIFSDPVAMRYYPKTKSREETEQWVRWTLESYRDHGFGQWVAVLKRSGEFAGQCGLTVQEVEGRQEVEIGYLFLRRFWGRGLATEAARVARDHGFALGYNRLDLPHRPREPRFPPRRREDWPHAGERGLEMEQEGVRLRNRH